MAAAQYGFHATIKPPFHLASPDQVEALDAALTSFASVRGPVALPRLVIDALGGFIAILLERPDDALQDLADACVREFDGYRAPTGAAERARRQAERLTDRQRAHLDNWGYPFVFEEWRFHMTLSCHLQDDERHRVLAALRRHLAPALAEPVRVEDLCLFHQPTGGGPFRILRRYPLHGVRPGAAR